MGGDYSQTFSLTIKNTSGLEGIVTTLAGGVGFPSAEVDGTGSAARFNRPTGIACDTLGNIYVTDFAGFTIRKIVASTAVVTTLAGTSSATGGSADGTGTAALFEGPTGIACDTLGNIYVGDTFNYTVRKIVASTAVVTTLAGTAGSSGSTNGTGAAARFDGPAGLVCDTLGNIYVVDIYGNSIRKIVASTAVVTTLAGSPAAGSANGTGSAARFWNPYGIALDGSLNAYVGDTNNDSVRKIA